MHSPTHRLSQELLQQNGSSAHTQDWQAQPPHVAAVLVVQPRPPVFVQFALQSLSHSPTQSESHAVAQQKGSMPHTHDSHGQPPQPGTPLIAWQPAPPHWPQSPAQVSQVSVPLQVPSPQTGPQAEHWFVASVLHRLSHDTSQQKVSPTVLQTHCSTDSTSQPGVPFAAQQSPVHEPQPSDSSAQMLSHELLQQKESMAQTQSVTAWFWQPMVVFETQQEPVQVHVPLQVPAEQASLLVHALLSLHGFVLFVNTHAPDDVLHESLVHALLSLQTFGVPGLHEPPAHASFRVHALPSLHEAVLFVNTQPLDGLHESLVHAFPSLQLSAPLPTHCPPEQVSVVVQALLSLQLAELFV